MSRKSLTIGFALSCVIALGISKAEAVAPEGIPNPAIVTEDGPLKGIISPDLRTMGQNPHRMA